MTNNLLDPHEREHIIDDVLAKLRSHGGRVSACRRSITEAMIDAGDHFTAEELAESVHTDHPDVHVSTVYRTLELFEELGIAYHVHLGHGPSQWHMADRIHGHLTCSECGVVIETDAAVFGELIERVRASTGFAVDVLHFALTGTCRECASAPGA